MGIFQWLNAYNNRVRNYSGYPLVFDPSNEKTVKRASFYGNSIQDGSNYDFTSDRSPLTLGYYLSTTGEFTAFTGRIAYYKDIDVTKCSSVTVTFTSSVSGAIFMYSLFNGSTTVEGRVLNNSSGTVIDTSGSTSLRLAFYTAGSVSTDVFTSTDDITSLSVIGDVTAPTPTAPINIESVGDRTANLFDKSNINWLKQGDLYYVWMTTGTGVITYGSSQTYTLPRTFYIPCKPSTTYTISFNNSYTKRLGTTASVPQIGDTVTDFVDNFEDSTKTITTSSTANYLIVQCYIDGNYSSITSIDPIINSLQIEEGSSATSYEPYGKYKLPVTIHGKNLLNPSATQVKDAYNSIRVADEGVSFRVKLFDKDITQDISGCYLCISDGPTYVGHSSSFSYLISNGAIQDTERQSYTSSNQYYLSVYPSNSTTWDKIFNRFNIMVEEGSVSTDYQEYISPTTQTLYLDQPLRKVGTYSDEIKLLHKSKNLSSIDTIKSGVALRTELNNVIPVGTYTFSYDNLDVAYSFYIYDKDKTEITFTQLAKSIVNGRAYITFSTDTPIKYLGIWTNGGASALNVQLELGSSATSYVPYGPCYEVTRNINTYTFDSSSNWSLNMTGTLSKRYAYTNFTGTLPSAVGPLCNKLTGISSGISSDVAYICNIQANGTAYVRIGINDAISILDGAEIIYPLATPTSTQYALSTTLKALPVYTKITVDTETSPSDARGSLQITSYNSKPQNYLWTDSDGTLQAIQLPSVDDTYTLNFVETPSVDISGGLTFN